MTTDRILSIAIKTVSPEWNYFVFYMKTNVQIHKGLGFFVDIFTCLISDGSVRDFSTKTRHSKHTK